MSRLNRGLTSFFVGLFAFVGSFFVLVPWGCNDVGGVPSWERCHSYINTPTFSVEDFGLDATLNIIQPMLVGLIVGILTWALIGVATSPEN